MTMTMTMMDQAAPPATDAESRKLSRLHIEDGRLKKQVCSECCASLAAVQSAQGAEASVLRASVVCTWAFSPGRMSEDGTTRRSLPNKDTLPLTSSTAPLLEDNSVVSGYGSVYLAIQHPVISCNYSVKSAIYTSAHLVGVAGRISGNYRFALTPFVGEMSQKQTLCTIR